MQQNRVFPGWWQVLVAFLVQGVSAGAVVFTYSVAVVPFAEAFQPSRMMLMMGITAMMAVSGVFAPWMGAAVDRYPIARMMVIGALCMALGYVLLSFSTAMWQVLLVYGLLMSVATTLAGPLAASTLLARWFSRRRGLVMGIASIGTSVGGFLFPPLLQWLIDSLEWRVAFRALGGIILLATLPWILLLVINRPADRGLHPDGEAPATPQAGAATATAAAPRFDNTGALLRNRNFWLIAIVMGCLLAVYTGVVSNLMPFALDSGASGERGALLLSLMAFCGIIGKLVFGAVADRIDLRVALAAALVLVCLGLSSYVMASGYAGLALGSVLLGLAAGGGLPVWAALIGHVFGPDNYGRAMGLMSPVITVFNLLAPPLAGRIHDITGGYQLAFALFTGALLLALTLIPFIRLGGSPRAQAAAA